jgi:GcrA cell cycle regulator
VTGHAWAEERLAEFNKLTAAGLSASQIAKRLGISRNAVCGKWDRLGVSKPRPAAPKPKPAPKPRTAAPKPAPRPRTAAPKPALRAAMHVPDLAPGSLDIDFMAITSTTCKWPVNDGNPFRFCGVAKPAEGGPYCAFHARVASGGRRPAA